MVKVNIAKVAFLIYILSIMYFNKTLIGQAGSIGGKTRQEVEVMQWEQENSGKQRGFSATPAQTTEEAACNLPSWERYGAIMANIDENNGLI